MSLNESWWLITFIILFSLPGLWTAYRDIRRVAAEGPRPSVESFARMEQAYTSQQARLDAQTRRIDELEAVVDELREGKAADRERMAQMQDEIDGLHRGIERLIDQLRAAGLTPVWTPEKKAPAARVVINRAALAARIEEGFNIEEMNDLAYDLGLTADSFAGDTAGARARALVELAGRRRKLPSLVQRVTELRPE